MMLTTTWKGKYHFESTDGVNVTLMDTKKPHGDGSALSPKQLALAAVCGCTAMDVYAHTNKHKQPPKTLRIEADAPLTEGHPAVFAHITLDYFFEGEIPSALAVEAVRLSQTKYCGVSAMMAKSCPIRYRVHMNGSLVNEGEAKFA
jgi:putative redox protein